MKLVACIVLGVVLTRHYGWGFVPPEMAGVVSKMLGAVASVVFLALIAHAYRSRLVWLACAYGFCDARGSHSGDEFGADDLGKRRRHAGQR